MPHCPVTVVQRYRDGVCSLLFHSFFIICHPYIPLHLEETCYSYCFLVVPMHHRCKKEICIILAITVDTYLSCSRFFSLCSTRGSNSDPTVTTLRYQYSGHKPHTTIVTRVRAGKVGGECWNARAIQRISDPGASLWPLYILSMGIKPHALRLCTRALQ